MDTPNVTITHKFLDAISPETAFDFIIDWTPIGSDTAAIFDVDNKNANDKRHGTFSDLENDLVSANKLHANIKIVLNSGMDSTDKTKVAFVQSNIYALAASIPRIAPTFSVRYSEQFHTSYWITESGSLEGLVDLQQRLQNHYKGNLSTLDPTMQHYLPGFIRHPDNANRKSVLIDFVHLKNLKTEEKPTVISLQALKLSLPPLPRMSALDRINDMVNAISEECSPYHLFTKPFSEHIIEVCDICIRKRYDINDIANLCLDIRWRLNCCCDEDDIYLMCFYSLEKYNTLINNTKSENQSNSLFPIKSAQIDYFLEAKPIPQRWLLDRCLPLGKVGLIVARGGTGKSQFAMQLSISIATGESLIPQWPTIEHGKVLALFAEDDESEIHRRLYAAANSLAINLPNQVAFFNSLRENLYIKSMVGKNNLMTSTTYSKEASPTDFRDRLLATIIGLGDIKLIIIDPVSRFRGGQENSAEDTTRFVEELERIASVTGATIIAIHHVNKSSSNNTEQLQEASRGSSALTDGVRWQMNLATMTNSEAKEYDISEDDRKFYVSLNVTKNNYAPPQGKVILKRNDSGTLIPANLMSSKQQKADDILSKIIELVRSEAKRGALYSKTGFEERFGGLDRTLKTGNNALRNLLGIALKAGRLLLHNRKLALPGQTVPHAKVIGSTE